ncbi:RNA exonuclease 5-like [Brachyhypopomus gauderio]|uniref:RNA exonuclease 5-like n=1 Tax=Brachyhypopomus gauderio TaxID=698409 RepID=UPI00404379A7
MADSAGCKRKRRDSPLTAIDHKKAKVITGSENAKQAHAPRFTRPHEHRCEQITLKDLTDLLHYASLGKRYGLKKPSWCRLHHQDRLARVHVAVLEGITQLHFYRYYSQFKHLRTAYTTRCTLAPPSCDMLSALLSAELSVPQESLQSSQTTTPTVDVVWHPVARRYGLKRRGLSSYLLTEEEMIKNNFPVQGGQGCEAFVCTQTDDHVTDSSPLYGLDCEMCVTQAGTELTHVAVVDSRGRCILDELVKPLNPIISYCTKFSGITPAVLAPVTTRLQDVQSKLLKLLPPDAVLVGHSLDNDLRALKLIHLHVIDSSLLYRREFGQRFKLKHLAQVILKREIQREEVIGHDPCEDACAALQVVQYFISKGPRQVLDLHLEDVWGVLPKTQQTPVNGALNESLHHTVSPLRIGQALHKAGHSALLLSKSAVSDSLSSNQVWRRHRCNSDKECVCVFKRVAQSYSLSVVQLSSLSDVLKRTTEESKETHLQQMLDRLEQMCVLFVGPLPCDYTEKKLHTLLRHYGGLRTVTLVQTTHRLYARVEFQHLEGAQLALHSLNGNQNHNQIIKAQRPLSEVTLDLEDSLTELQNDVLNDHMIYVGGLSPHHHSYGDLLQAFSSFGPINSIITPAKKSGKCRRHSHIEFVSAESVPAAVRSPVQIGDRKLHVCCALTPTHMHTWTHTRPVTMAMGGDMDNPEEERRELDSSGQITGNETDPSSASNCVDGVQEGEMERVMRALDRNVGKMFKALQDKTLSIVILPGSRRGPVEYPGLCFFEVKQV